VAKAQAAVTRFEVMRMFKKGQFQLWPKAVDGVAEIRFVNRL
jgi:hypothetical protein